MKNSMVLFVLLLMASAAYSIAQTPGLLSEIPDSLKEKANAILLLEKTTVEVRSESNAVKNVHREVAVLNEQGQSAGDFLQSYDKFSVVSAVEVTVFNAAGEKIKRFNRNDLKDYSASGSSILIGDQRNLFLPVSTGQYPYKVVTDYTINYNGFISLPSWYPQEEYQSVLKASYTFMVPMGYLFNYQLRNYAAEPKITSGDDGEVYSWTLKNIVAFQVEKYGPSPADQAISLSIAPVKFSIDNYDGSAASWKTFGSWYYGLTKGRQQLADKNISKITSLVKGINEPVEKSKALYEYLQRNTRYINIVLGIGGWQPLSADFVAEHGYGDCKALTNYMQAMLGAAGVESFPALAGADESDIDVSFTGNQFNHVILVIPSQKDTLWLECTSQHLPFNFLSSYTENRHVLLIRPDGGYIVKTPATEPQENFISNRFTVDLTEPKSAAATINMKFHGNEAINYHLSLAEFSDDKKLDALREGTGLPNFMIDKFEYFPFNADSVSGMMNITATIPEFSQTTSTRIFFTPFIIPAWYAAISQKGKRKFPVVFDYRYDNQFDGTFRIPEGYRIESLPKDFIADNEFFKYQSRFLSVDNVITVHYSIALKQTLIPAQKFEEFNIFINQVVSDQKKKIVLVKNQ